MKKLLSIILIISITSAVNSQILINGHCSIDTTMQSQCTVKLSVTYNGQKPFSVRWNNNYGCGNLNGSSDNPNYLYVDHPQLWSVCVFDTLTIGGELDTVYVGFEYVNFIYVTTGINTQITQNGAVFGSFYDLLGRSTEKGVLNKKSIKIKL